MSGPSALTSRISEWVENNQHGMSASAALDAVNAIRAVTEVHWYDADNEGCGSCCTFAAPCDTQRAVAEALGVES